MGEAMYKYKRPFGMHVFEISEHGMSVCNELSVLFFWLLFFETLLSQYIKKGEIKYENFSY